MLVMFNHSIIEPPLPFETNVMTRLRYDAQNLFEDRTNCKNTKAFETAPKQDAGTKFSEFPNVSSKKKIPLFPKKKEEPFKLKLRPSSNVNKSETSVAEIILKNFHTHFTSFNPSDIEQVKEKINQSIDKCDIITAILELAYDKCSHFEIAHYIADKAIEHNLSELIKILKEKKYLIQLRNGTDNWYVSNTPIGIDEFRFAREYVNLMNSQPMFNEIEKTLEKTTITGFTIFNLNHSQVKKMVENKSFVLLTEFKNTFTPESEAYLKEANLGMLFSSTTAKSTFAQLIKEKNKPYDEIYLYQALLTQDFELLNYLLFTFPDEIDVRATINYIINNNVPINSLDYFMSFIKQYNSKHEIAIHLNFIKDMLFPTKYTEYFLKNYPEIVNVVQLVCDFNNEPTEHKYQLLKILMDNNHQSMKAQIEGETWPEVWKLFKKTFKKWANNEDEEDEYYLPLSQ